MRITSKGQVTIPQAILERFGLFPHTAVSFREENGHVVIEKDDDQPSRGYEGIRRLREARLRTRLTTEELLSLTRGEAS
ncbi:AbrB/MazE/SpoVT family DNA-binding domain-containing protein [Cyanobium sp. ATX 6F1]|uniref:AbrB/MazE/SpoVT family DNA-binding domain-containing protein n=1 Tax=unclassified Cyanobium TaxID=2627006 RepID=UPI0020CB75F9|nr:AbrB/MazE/SpoVT family DNA-binding domain-containing protein [Cyanobium sp. ATX 6F1]MCP9915833.1 AbrB/MazE/SpoVT family DNA-binding domain-containing protein [Cyanobium sp. ATX 6F1]